MRQDEMILAGDGTRFRLTACPTCGTFYAILDSLFQSSVHFRDVRKVAKGGMPIIWCPSGHQWHYNSLDEIAAKSGAAKPPAEDGKKAPDEVAAASIVEAILEKR